jgi:signal transduction histidine kinase/CheY-like chemotaxis protein
MSAEQLIDICRNSPTVESLCRILVHDLSCDFVLIAWSVCPQYWYIASIYDSTIQDKVNTTGWYVSEEPKETNIPIKHGNLLFATTLKTKNTKLIWAKCEGAKSKVIRKKRRSIKQVVVKVGDPTDQIGFLDRPLSAPCDAPVLQTVSLTPTAGASKPMDLIPKSMSIPVKPLPLEPLKSISETEKIDVTALPPSAFIISPFYSFVIESFLDKLASADLLKRQKFRQELMLSNISHSIRTPLNGILHMTSSIMSATKSLPELKISEQLGYLNQSAVALATNIFDIVDMTKLELGKLSINKELFDLRELIVSVMSLANSLNKSKAITLDYYVNPNVPEFIFSDKKRIKQILINLLENSLQHTQKGEITLLVESNIINLANEDKRDHSIVEDTHGLYHTTFQHSITFMVRDTGAGMSEQIKSNLFKPLEVLVNAKQHGLSLKISMLLANLLGGSLSLVYSEIEKGTCFNLNIIVSEEEAAPAPSKSQILKGKSVLLIDNSPNRITMCQCFEKYEMPYTIASTYDEFVILHAGKQYDMVIVRYDVQEINIMNIKSQVTTNILLGIGDVPQSVQKAVGFTDVMADSTDVTDYKSKFIKLFETLPKVAGSIEKYKIMIVEDEQINKIVMEKILRQLGFHKIEISSNGEDALKNFIANPCHIMLIDIRMPGMNGYELANKIHEYCETSQIQEPKMIGVTAQVVLDAEDVKPWFNVFIYKPINVAELDEKIRASLDVK